LAVLLHGPHVVEQIALDARQTLQNAVAAGVAKQRLNHRKIDDRATVEVVVAGKLPNERIGKICHNRSARGRQFVDRLSVVKV
jgi:hypothetical protein